MFAIFERHIDKHGECKFILAGESGKFNEERIGGHLTMSYHLWYGRGAVAYFIFKVFQNLLAEWASVPRYFSNGNSQTYPSLNAMQLAAKNMGGEAKVVDTAAKIYTFVPKK